MQFHSFGFGDEQDGEVTGDILGGKGAGLVWLAQQGVPVPPGFVIPTSVWAEYDQKPKTTMKAIAKALPAYLSKLEAHFGYLPLLSVRSGARVSCPGMMDTILNVGIDAETTPAWATRLGSACFGDSFQRLVTMYGSVVHGQRKESFGSSLKEALAFYQTQVGTFPDAKAQLLGAIEAVFKSWDNDRANEYRKMHGYDRAWGTAVTIQAMVFGNLNDQSATGVLFTRNPDTGGQVVTGEFLPNAQGEDIVAGIRTPLPLDAMKTWNPTVYTQLLDQVLHLENLKRDVLDIEFTVQDHTLYLLQVRTAKRSALAAIKIATDLVTQGQIDVATAVKRVSVKQFDVAQMATVDPKFTKAPAFTGLPACGGVVSGKPVFTSAEALTCTEPCILVSHETTPDDIAGMAAAKGVITMVGGMTSHAAVNARGMDRACIVGVGQSVEAFKDVEVLSLDGATGRIWTEQIPIVSGTTNGVVHAFGQMVCQSLNVVPVIFKVPTHHFPEALLYLGDQILDSERAVATVLATLAQVDRLYLDLVPSAEEQRFLSLVSAFDHTGHLLGLLHTAVPVAQRERLVVVTTTEYPVSFPRLLPNPDLRSLVLSDQEVVLTGVDAADSAIQRVLAWKKNEGVSVVSLGTYLPEAKSMISVSQALQLVSNGKGG